MNKSLEIVILEDQIEAQRYYNMNLARFAAANNIDIQWDIFSTIDGARTFLADCIDDIDIIIADRTLYDGTSTDYIKALKDSGKYTIAVTDVYDTSVQFDHAAAGNRFYQKADFLLNFQSEFGSIVNEVEPLNEQQEFSLEII